MTCFKTANYSRAQRLDDDWLAVEALSTTATAQPKTATALHCWQSWMMIDKVFSLFENTLALYTIVQLSVEIQWWQSITFSLFLSLSLWASSSNITALKCKASPQNDGHISSLCTSWTTVFCKQVELLFKNALLHTVKLQTYRESKQKRGKKGQIHVSKICPQNWQKECKGGCLVFYLPNP